MNLLRRLDYGDQFQGRVYKWLRSKLCSMPRVRGRVEKSANSSRPDDRLSPWAYARILRTAEKQKKHQIIGHLTAFLKYQPLVGGVIEWKAEDMFWVLCDYLQRVEGGYGVNGRVWPCRFLLKLIFQDIITWHKMTGIGEAVAFKLWDFPEVRDLFRKNEQLDGAFFQVFDKALACNAFGIYDLIKDRSELAKKVGSLSSMCGFRKFDGRESTSQYFSDLLYPGKNDHLPPRTEDRVMSQYRKAQLINDDVIHYDEKRLKRCYAYFLSSLKLIL